MAKASKNVLVAGMGRFVSAQWEQQGKNGQQKTNRQVVLDDIEKAKAAGYNCTSIDVNPEDPENTLRQVRQELQKRHCDLFIIGFAVRGNANYTSMFEQLVNTSVEVSPRTRFGFMPAPSEVFFDDLEGFVVEGIREDHYNVVSCIPTNSQGVKAAS